MSLDSRQTSKLLRILGKVVFALSLPTMCSAQVAVLQEDTSAEVPSYASDQPALTLLSTEVRQESGETLSPGVLYAVGANSATGFSLLFSIDNFTSAPAARSIARFNRNLFDVAIDPTTKRLYVLDSNSDLYRVDLDNLQSTHLGRAPFGTNSLEFDSKGQAFAWGSRDRRLYKLNKNTGGATAVGDTGYTASGDLAFDLNGVLFGTTSDGYLIRINTTTGGGTRIGPTGFDDLYGLEVDSSGELFAGRGSNLTGVSQIYRINKKTGASSLVGSMTNGSYPITGLALFSPSRPPGLYLSRLNILLIGAEGSPQGGAFSYTSKKISGKNVATITFGVNTTPTDNPNRARLKSPANPNPKGVPAQGGLALATATYTLDQNKKFSKQFRVPTFGLSCYYTTTEAEWGTPPRQCKTIKINKEIYSGAEANPAGLTGVYCRSFIAQVKLQGSAVTNDNRKIQYNPTNGRIGVVKKITAGGKPVIAGKTVARDTRVIPGNGTLIDLDGVGTGLMAHDTGGDIKDYRIDLYKGIGKGVCENFDNRISVATCNPGNDRCPAGNLQ